MRKLEKRARLCLLICLVLLVGLGIYIGKFALHGDEWVVYPANSHIYTDGNLNRGIIYDINGELLAENTENGIRYSEDRDTRTATVHVVGDRNRNIAGSAESSFQDILIGYNPVTGVHADGEKKITLTIDSQICETANKALNGRRGLVGVYNYETGDIVCLVSSPNFDPENPPKVAADDDSGIYVNRFLSSAIVPGSIFKLVTSAAAIENLDMSSWSYTCRGAKEYGPDRITCPSAHGTVDFEQALAKSCNCAFADISDRLGGNVLEKYVEQFGLTESVDLNGIKSSAGSFSFPQDTNVNLAWSGIGQYQDLINPCSYLRFVGAIAGGGEAAEPKIISSVRNPLGLKSIGYRAGKTGELIDPSTASQLKMMMKNNVEETYGESSFPDLDIYAKSGTAEVGENKMPNSWFTGFIDNPGNPYAFIVLVENGGSGASVAGSIANTVLQAIVD